MSLKTGAILVVEDEGLIRMFAASAFEDAGYTVLEAGSAAEALHILEARDDVILVFTDVNMPGNMNGIKLAATVRDRWPNVNIAVTSGMAVPREGEIPPGGYFVPKPYSKKDIERIPSLFGV